MVITASVIERSVASASWRARTSEPRVLRSRRSSHSRPPTASVSQAAVGGIQSFRLPSARTLSAGGTAARTPSVSAPPCRLRPSSQAAAAASASASPVGSSAEVLRYTVPVRSASYARAWNSTAAIGLPASEAGVARPPSKPAAVTPMKTVRPASSYARAGCSSRLW